MEIRISSILQMTLLLLTIRTTKSVEYNDPLEATGAELKHAITYRCIPPGYRCPDDGDLLCCHGCDTKLLVCLNSDGTVIKKDAEQQ
ncbi:unnamed protein product [Allacma fusca]|uniref:Secreted protein n=1 Tax=Allacma fusca TaxID=39272 RepID=A0A8J2J4M9_9HEXA|nr:unnamed protein product [Allacma fusca]